MLAWVIAGVVAGFIEATQSLVGRSMRIEDAVAGVLGAFWGLAVYSTLRTEQYRTLLPLAVLGGVVSGCGLARPWAEMTQARDLQERSFPRLAQFDAPAEELNWVATGLGRTGRDGTAMTRVPLLSSESRWALKVCTTHDVDFPGVRLLLPEARWNDWRNYDALELQFYRETGPLTLCIRIDDEFPFKSRTDRFNTQLVLRPGWNRFSIPITKIEHGPTARKLDLQRIRRVVFFLDHPGDRETFYVGPIQLLRKRAAETE
jgi:uncharacterized membrane protein YeaQ/YmgE (transglycosylase-associated protein family)